MSAAGRKLRRVGTTATYSGGYVHWCPACEKVHQYQVPRWTFNGNLDAPSFQPSMRISTGNRVPGHEDKYDEGSVCHYVMTDGKIAYCGDCTHSMAGQTVDLPDWPHAPGNYGGIED